MLKEQSYRPHSECGWNGKPANSQTMEVDLVGQAWFFRKEWLKYMWYEEPVTYDNGEDIHFSYMAQKHGSIPTYVPPHPENDRDLWGSLQGDVLGNDPVATWNQPGHFELRDQVVKESIQRGWKPMFMRS